MHSAPALSHPVGRSRFQVWLLGLVGLGGVSVSLLWHHATGLGGWRQWLFDMSLLAAWVSAVVAWSRAPEGNLRWDGQVWSWTSADQVVCGRMTVHLDLQFCLILSLRTGSGRRIWLWPERTDDVALWSALRRAVFSGDDAGQIQNVSADAEGRHR